PRLLPQLADTTELVAFAKTLPGLFTSVLVPNLKGAERAIDSGADLMLVPLSASHAHSLANLRKPPDEVVEEIARIRAARDAAGSRCEIEVGLSTAFGCTIQGRVEPSEVLRLIKAVLDAGVDRVGLADTVGYADPVMVQDLFTRALAVAGDRLACGHFHDTRGLGMANGLPPWQLGIKRFDACLAGIGGCPHAPGASGNVTTEDVVYMFASMGVSTGQNFDALMALRAKVARWLEGETLHGTVSRRRPRFDGEGRCRRKRSTTAARGTSRRRVHAHGDGPDVRNDARRYGRRGDQGRADRRRPHAPPPRRWRRLLSYVQSQQEEHRHRSASARGRRCRAQARCERRCRRRKLQAGYDGQVRTRLRGAVEGQPAADLCQSQGLSARSVRSSNGARRGRADDGRPRVHDRPS